MTSRIAVRARLPWCSAIGLALVAGTVASSGSPAGPAAPPPGRALALHVKLAAHAHLPAALHATPLFTALPPATHDGRERWVAVTADPATLAGDPAVEDIVEPAVFALPSQTSADGDSCPIHTPAYDQHQEYVGPAPAGIDAPAAWRAGVRGQGVWFADVEGGWNATHEDLPGDRITHVHGRTLLEPSWRAHGTAVLGEVVARDNGKGVVGLAPDTERVFTASIAESNPADAIDAAAEQLRAGDVLLIELQGVGPRGRYVPVELWDDVFAAIAAATDRGVVVVEAAGNGGEDLDHRAYRGKLDRTKRDSGAIMVGAGAPPRPGYDDRTRLEFSNFGGRVDVQGWGRMVATLDYGDLQACDDSSRDRHYTGLFSGTSSASPIVAGAAILIESAARQRGGVIPPLALRALLTATGSPQRGNTREHIGPRPDLARAFGAL